MLLDLSDATILNQSENFTQQPTKRRALKNVKNVHIQERKAAFLTDNDILATQEVISEHVSLFLNDCPISLLHADDFLLIKVMCDIN